MNRTASVFAEVHEHLKRQVDATVAASEDLLMLLRSGFCPQVFTGPHLYLD